MTKIIKNISEILNFYEVYILDQWGVMHDGYKGYDHAIKAVKKLIKLDKKLIIVSNSSRRNEDSSKNLSKYKYDKNDFITIMTSGEMIWKELSENIEKYEFKHNNCYHIYDKNIEGGLNFRQGLKNFNFVEDISKADFILACTPFYNSKPLDYVPLLKQAIDLKLVFFCANPDYISPSIVNGEYPFCMGTIADLYKNMGGHVIILGKPNKSIYIKATEKINNLDLKKCVTIGDSLHHDIQGAQNFGIDSILISSGIHSNLFKSSLEQGLLSMNNSKKYPAKPTYICDKFSF
tara:strand:- start:6270 stop:7142 length:873 start_codon:yes stop_codon:yes gene_type:complete